MEDEKKSVQQQTDSTDAVGADSKTADTKVNSQPEQQPGTELKKPTPKKTAAQTETAAVAEEKPVQSQNTTMCSDAGEKMRSREEYR